MSQLEAIVIEAGAPASHYWRDLWRHRELLYFLAWRDVAVRYKQAAFGAAWALIRPALTMAVLAFAFGRIAKLPSGGIDYLCFTLAGVLPWQLFAGAFSEGGQSLLNNANLVSKVYFPRIIVPASSLLVNLADFGVSLLLMLVLMLWRGQELSPWALLLPVAVLLCLMLALGAALWVAGLSIRYRDVRFLLPFIIQAGLFASPVGYGTATVPEAYQMLYLLNPMCGCIELFRACAFGVFEPWLGAAVLSSALWAVLLLLSGSLFFRARERELADLI